MADSQHNIDWTAVRKAALDCLDATWTLICFAEWSQGDDYGADRAALHLAAIDRAGDTFRRATCMFSPDHFDSIAKASVGEGPRPDFRFGGVCCATAHETAYELLRRALLWVENGLNDELDDRGLGDQYVAGIDDLHELSLEALRDTLSRLEKRKSAQSLIDARGVHQVRAWIDREWAAVSQSLAKANLHGRGKPENTPLLERMADALSKAQLAIVTRLLESSANYKSLRETPGCFRDGATDDSVSRSLERLRDKVNQYPEWDVTLTVSHAKKRASLQVLSDKTTDK